MARTKKFIAHFSEENLAKYPQEVRDLIDKGRQRGFVTQQELMHALPNLEEDVEFADEVYTLLLELGLDLIDVKEEMIWGKRGEDEEPADEDLLDEDLLKLAESDELGDELAVTDDEDGLEGEELSESKKKE